ncbi:MAG: CPBP family intramembrane metalloprotease [Alphaproteobacteria bacterium]|nr:CPBP family intramembrane metalloprotease [Alphaproteobacteria bacterium]
MTSLGAPRVSARQSPLAFFVLLFVLTVPFWILGWASGQELLPKLPLSALAVVCPMLAAVILEYRRAGLSAASSLLERAFDYRRIASLRWFAPILLLAPAIMVASYWIMWAMGLPLPPFELQITRAVFLFAVFFVSGLLEELGWSGYAIDPLQEQYGALGGALIVGVVWAAWHLIPLLQVDRPFDWIAAWTLGTVALRVLTVWIYNNTGHSVFAAAVFHAMCNLSWQMFPVAGSAYDARITGPLEALIAALVVAYFGTRTLRRIATS